MLEQKFRNDINGLRAISVVAVLLFHFKFPGAAGGFAGVDIFFVISGFLMTEIVLNRQEQGRFSIWQFLMARARRIVPALLFLVICCLAWGYFFVDALVFDHIGREAFQALLFISNFALWRNVGYFDARADEKWFLHTWSLSLEWQFYLLFPFAMIVLNWLFPDLKRKFIAFFLSVIAAFALSMLYQYVSHASTFYLLPFRAWELLAGGLVAFLNRMYTPSAATRNLLMQIGLATIAVSIIAFDRMTTWPSFATLLPVGGAVAVLLADLRNARWAANPVMAALGQWSYSIYLWHWPFIVAWVYLDLPFIYALPGFVVFFLGGAMAFSVGLPLIQAVLSSRALWTTGIAAWVLAIAAGLIVERQQGFPERHPSDPRYVANLRAASMDWGFPPNCNGLDKNGGPKICGFNLDIPGRPVVFLGDSHSSLWFNRFKGSEAQATLGPIIFMTAAACPPVKGMGRAEQHVRCDGFYEAAIRQVESIKPRRLVISSIWTTYAQLGGNDRVCFFAPDSTCIVPANAEAFRAGIDSAFEQTTAVLRRLRETGIDVVIVLPLPIHKRDIPKSLARLDFNGTPKEPVARIDHELFMRENALIFERLRKLAEAVGATLVDPSSALCSNGVCATVGRDGKPLYMDSNHLTSNALKLDRFRFVDSLVAP